ncbi:MAG: phosphate ABC transporter permease PstA [Candidatus Lokiarchaeota archaeon]
MIIAIPLGIGTAIYIAELAPPKVRKYLKSAIEILSGIPSIVFGFFGAYILNEWIMNLFNVSTGDSWLSGSIVLGIMALPTIISVCEDAISSVPDYYREASLGLGATKWQTISKVVLPAGMSGITAGIILGVGRAIGETMAVMMVTGNNIVIPSPITNVFSGIRTITATIALELGDATGLHQDALFALGIILFLITLLINTSANLILSRLNKKFQGISEESIFSKIIPTRIKTSNIRENIKKYYRRYKKPALLITGVLLLGWVLSTWYGVLPAILISSLIVAIFYLFRRFSSRIKQKVSFIIITLTTILVLVILVILIGFIVSLGIPAMLQPGFLTTMSRGPQGGILDAIVGTLYLIGGTVLFSVPIGILAGIYLSEYAKENKITKVIRAGIDNLNGTPSIVFALFGYLFFILYLKFAGGKYNLLAGQLTLALMILPTIIKTTEEAIKAVPQSFRTGSLALGSSKWQSIYKVVLPAALPGIITGVILGMGRSAGETAPIIYTSCVSTQRGLPNSPLDPVNALTYHIYILLIAYKRSEALVPAGGSALTLLLLVVILYGIAFLIRNHYKKKKNW